MEEPCYSQGLSSDARSERFEPATRRDHPPLGKPGQVVAEVPPCTRRAHSSWVKFLPATAQAWLFHALTERGQTEPDPSLETTTSSLPSGVIAACPDSPAPRGKLAPSCCSGVVIHNLTQLSTKPIVVNLLASRPKEMLATGPAATSAAFPICVPVAAFHRWTTPPVDPVKSVPSGAVARLTAGPPTGRTVRSIRRAAASTTTTRPSSRPAAMRRPSGETVIERAGLPSASFLARTPE